MPSTNLTPVEWLDEIEQGLEYRRRFGLEDMWGQIEATYYNVHESMMNDGPNILLSQGDAMMSTLTVPTARIKVAPVKPEEVDKAPIVESLDNILVRDLDLASEIDTVALHTFLFGRGFLKQGYDSEWGYSPEHDLGGSLQLGLTLTQLNSRGTRRIEYDSGISPGSPWCRAVLPHDIIVPWGVWSIDTTPWIAHRIVRHIDDLRADQKYTVPRALQPQLSIQDFMDSYRSAQKVRFRKMNSREPEYVEMFEIHDRRTGQIFVVTNGHDRFLRKDTNALQIENKLPFTSLAFTPRARAFWTTPDAYYLFYIQNELSDVARQRTKQRRISTLKFLYDGDAIDDDELQKILSPDVGVAAKVTGGHDLSKIITKIENNPNQVLAQEEDLLRANAREQIGFSRNQVGEYQGGRKTATEASIVDNSSKLRMSRRGLLVKRLYEDTIRTVNNIVFSYWTLPRYVQALGQAKAAQWMQIHGPSLKGRYDYSVEFSSDEDLRARKLEALQLYNLLRQDPTVDPEELKQLLIHQVNDPSFERLFSANVSNGVSGVQTGGGGVQPAGGGGANGGRAVRGLPVAPAQQTSQRVPNTVLAGGGGYNGTSG